MNYYKHHIGDYATTTAHLTFVEDAAYSRLLHLYYRDERPLPGDIREIQRLARARTRLERTAVETVLREFFRLEADAWHNSRCDNEIAKYQAQAETNRKIAQDRESARREERARAEHESWSDRGPNQQPRTKYQEPNSASEQANTRTLLQKAAEQACRLMDREGCPNANAYHPDLLAALNEGVTPEALATTVGEGVSRQASNPFAWGVTVARERHAEGARPVAAGAAKNAFLRLVEEASLATRSP